MGARDLDANGSALGGDAYASAEGEREVLAQRDDFRDARAAGDGRRVRANRRADGRAGDARFDTEARERRDDTLCVVDLIAGDLLRLGRQQDGWQLVARDKGRRLERGAG